MECLLAFGGYKRNFLTSRREPVQGKRTEKELNFFDRLQNLYRRVANFKFHLSRPAKERSASGIRKGGRLVIINEYLLCGIITLRLLRKPFKEMKTYLKAREEALPMLKKKKKNEISLRSSSLPASIFFRLNYYRPFSL